MARKVTERTPKDALIGVMRELREEYGLGCRTVGKLLGYSETYVRSVTRDFRFGPADQFAALEMLTRSLPDSLQSKVRAIKSRNISYWTHTPDSNKVRSPRLARLCAHPTVDQDE